MHVYCFSFVGDGSLDYGLTTRHSCTVLHFQAIVDLFVEHERRYAFNPKAAQMVANFQSQV